MKKLVISMSVELSEETFARLCLACGGFTRIPGTDLFQLPEFTSVQLSKILDKGVRENSPAPHLGLGSAVNGTGVSLTAESTGVLMGSSVVTSGSNSEGSSITGSTVLASGLEATGLQGSGSEEGPPKDDPLLKERASKLLGNAAGLRGLGRRRGT